VSIEPQNPANDVPGKLGLIQQAAKLLWVPSKPAETKRSGWPTRIMALVGVSLPIAGFLAILCYTGFHASYGIAAITALAAGAMGLVLGLLFGVPRAVSSGEYRQNPPKYQDQSATDTPGSGGNGSPAQGTGTATTKKTDNESANASTLPRRYSTSTNLAEVSDWLTKLLLGAGLVSLTRLGGPIGHLIDSVALGMSKGGGGSSNVFAGSILIGYAAIGFLDGYMVTTLWYESELNRHG
jgi:hypothetical protein